MKNEIISKWESLATKRPIVVVQGLGFVGSAMVAALSMARTKSGDPSFNVIGVDLPTETGLTKINAIKEGHSPVVSEDPLLERAIFEGVKLGNITATDSVEVYNLADYVVVDIHLDVHKQAPSVIDYYRFSYEDYERALEVVASRVKQDALIVIETTVPPGTTEKIVRPLFERIYRERGMDTEGLLLAHSYERVMPGKNYVNSIINFYRVYSGINDASFARVKLFLEEFINVEDYPLTEVHSTTASEMAKVLENSYRAMNIAFIQEWTEFANEADVNLFEVIQAIRKRPTHSNIMLPGFGVGGYCLTKDALLADYGSRVNFNGKSLKHSLSAISTNDLMPNYTCELLNGSMESLKGKRIAILGVSYLNDVADTRYSPTRTLYQHCHDSGAEIFLHDPMLNYWIEQSIPVHRDFKSLKAFKPDCLIFCIGHAPYKKLDANEMNAFSPNLSVVIDANNVLTDETALALQNSGISIIGVGKGHWQRNNTRKN